MLVVSFTIGVSMAVLRAQAVAPARVAAARTTPCDAPIEQTLRPCVKVRVVEDLRTRDEVVVDLIDIEPRERFTPATFSRTARRLDELPSASRTRLNVVPERNGAATIEASIAERSMLPQGLGGWAVVGGRAMVTTDLALSVVSPTGSGEVWKGAYRWKKNRPRLAFALDAPRFARLPGVARLDVFWEQQTYQPLSTSPVFRETRRHVGVTITEWATGGVQWSVGGGYDRFDERNHLGATGGVEVRWFDDRVAAHADVSAWTPSTAGSFRAVRFGLGWRSTADELQPFVTARFNVTAVSAAAPFALWPGASTGNGREGLLRAHPLLDEGVLTGAMFGRRLTNATIEYSRPIRRISIVSLSLATFVDLARASFRANGRSSPALADLGGGIRVGHGSNRIRVDVACGLGDHRWQLSAGFLSAWPR